MRVVALALSLALSPASPPAKVGIAWVRDAEVDGATKQRLATAVAERLELDEAQLINDAVASARQMISHELPVEQIDQLADIERRMNRGNLRFRVGEFDAAEAEAELVLDAVRGSPVLPGASSLLWRAHLLRARVAWTRADDPGVEAALRAAVTVDPTARLSTRRVPPDFAAVYERISKEVRSTPWQTPQITDLAQDDLVEIDGQPGIRAVAPGEHVLVVRRPGRAPFGALFTVGTPVRLPPTTEVIASGFPATTQRAEQICDQLELTQIVLARQREDRLGLELYRCNDGFSEAWFGFSDQTATDGMRRVALASVEDRDRSVLPSDDPWPSPVVEPPTTDRPIRDKPVIAKKPWYKRAWIWVVVGGVVVGGVVTGAVLGTRPPDQVYRVPADDFLRQ